jgi:catalase
MTEKDFIKIENKFQTQLPDDYKDFQINYPKELIDANFNHEFLTNNPEYFIKLNEMFRNAGLPEIYIVIGHDYGGNHFFIKNSKGESSVFYHDHEEASAKFDDAENPDELTWEDVLDKKHKNLTDFGIWLLEVWKEV